MSEADGKQTYRYPSPYTKQRNDAEAAANRAFSVAETKRVNPLTDSDPTSKEARKQNDLVGKIYSKLDSGRNKDGSHKGYTKNDYVPPYKDKKS